MITHNLVQGSPEWEAHRASHFNASDAPAMLGISPYKTRSQLLREIATGITPEIDAATQRRFDDGHRFEALARPLAEKLFSEELYPCTGSLGRLSASFDGLTLLGDGVWEHKTLNDSLRAAFDEIEAIGAEEFGVLDARTLPEHYRVQMEQQCMVSGAEHAIFMASNWDGETLIEQRSCHYMPDLELRERIIAGWEQFERDLADYVPEPQAAPAPVAAALDSLPTIAVQVSGQITIRENFEAFELAARSFLETTLIRSPQTDQDFVDLDLQIKMMKDAEAALDAAETQIIAQVETIDSAKRKKDMLAKLIRDNRLMAEKLLASEKERRRAEIVDAGIEAVGAHYAAINATLEAHAILAPQSLRADIAAAIKGRRTLSSITDAVDTAVASAKIGARRCADRVRACQLVLADYVTHTALFPDAVALCASKSPEDLRNLIAARIADHEARESKRIEEAAKLLADQRLETARELDRQAASIATTEPPKGDDARAAAEPAPQPAASSGPATLKVGAAHTPTGATIRLGEINARIAPLSITADGLQSLGFAPVGTERSAKMYAESKFSAICRALIATLEAATKDAAA